MHSSSNIYHHIAAATNIMLLTVRHDIVEREATSLTSHIMMCCVMNTVAVDFLNKFEHPVRRRGPHIIMRELCTITAYYIVSLLVLGHHGSAWLVVEGLRGYISLGGVLKEDSVGDRN
jgi:hypothetical protein